MRTNTVLRRLRPHELHQWAGLVTSFLAVMGRSRPSRTASALAWCSVQWHRVGIRLRLPGVLRHERGLAELLTRRPPPENGRGWVCMGSASASSGRCARRNRISKIVV